VSTTQQVKAIAIDPPGNPSPIMVANYTVAVATPTVTNTTLAASPASPQVAGTPVNLSASVMCPARPWRRALPVLPFGDPDEILKLSHDEQVGVQAVTRSFT